MRRQTWWGRASARRPSARECGSSLRLFSNRSSTSRSRMRREREATRSGAAVHGPCGVCSDVLRAAGHRRAGALPRTAPVSRESAESRHAQKASSEGLASQMRWTLARPIDAMIKYIWFSTVFICLKWLRGQKQALQETLVSTHCLFALGDGHLATLLWNVSISRAVWSRRPAARRHAAHAYPPHGEGKERELRRDGKHLLL